MYEVACPTCHAKVSTPFVRVGALAVCPACKHRYLVDATHIRRVPAGQSDAAAALAAQEPAPVIGRLQNLSELMHLEAQRERDSQFNDYDTLAPAPDAPRAPIIPEPAVEQPKPAPAPVSPPDEKTERRLKVVRGGYLLAAAVAMSLAVLGIGFWMFKSLLWNPLESPALKTLNEPQQPAEPVYEGPVFQGLPLVISTLLDHEPWEQPNRPYRSAPPQDDAIYLTDASLEPAGAGVIEYTGRVVSERPGVLRSGTLTLSLVNPQGTEVARTVMPIALISPDRSLRVQVPIPANLDPTSLHPVWAIAPGEFSDTAAFLPRVTVVTQSQGADTMARVDLRNQSPDRLEQTDFVITAWDDQARPLRRWLVKWSLPIPPGGSVEFFTRTGVNPSWDIREWTVDAAG